MWIKPGATLYLSIPSTWESEAAGMGSTRLAKVHAETLSSETKFANVLNAKWEGDQMHELRIVELPPALREAGAQDPGLSPTWAIEHL